MVAAVAACIVKKKYNKSHKIKQIVFDTYAQIIDALKTPHY